MIKADTILAYALVVPYIMGYRLSPGSTPYWFFGIIFAFLLLYLAADLFWQKKKFYPRLKTTLAAFLVFGVLGPGLVSAIIVRHRHGPEYWVHDIILQLEAAIGLFLQGKNPYAVDYFGTPVELFPYTEDGLLMTNPALYHFVMPPFYLLFSTLFYFLSVSTAYFFDGRLPLMFLLFSVLYLVIRNRQKLTKKLSILFLFAYNPANLNYFMEGRSDWFGFAFLFFALWLLDRGQPVLAGLPLAFAFGSKQSIWPIFPFWLAYLYWQQKGYWPKRLVAVIKQMLLFGLAILIIFTPFLIWDSQAFINSTFRYLSGSLETAYPISGYGLGKLMVARGWVDAHQYHPFWIYQAVVGLPLAGFLISQMKKRKSLSFLVFSYTIFLFVFWYFSRYFNNNHVSFLSLLLIAAWFFHEKE